MGLSLYKLTFMYKYPHERRISGDTIAWSILGIVILTAFIAGSINAYTARGPNPVTKYNDEYVFVKTFGVTEGEYKGSVTYNRHVVFARCKDSTMCMEWPIQDDSVWYNLKPGQIHHFKYVLKSRFWKLK